MNRNADLLLLFNSLSQMWLATRPILNEPGYQDGSRYAAEKELFWATTRLIHRLVIPVDRPLIECAWDLLEWCTEDGGKRKPHWVYCDRETKPRSGP